MPENIGFLHPGEMGVSIAASARNNGHTAVWASEGRSPETQRRAREHGLQDAGSLDELCRTCSVVVSICPPHAAEDVARGVLAASFHGLYVDANAISPQRAVRIGALLREGGVDFVDGGIIGGPAWETGQTWLYLAGSQAQRVSACFSAGPLQTRIIGDEIGRASALKMCYAAYTKGTSALLAAILGAAEGLGVRDELAWQWAQDDPGFGEQTARRVRRVTAKAWRFAGEMEEIAATFEAVGLPGGFHAAAADVFGRMAAFKGRAEPPELSEVLEDLLDGPAKSRDTTVM